MEVADLVAKFSAEGDERVVRALDRVDAGVSRVADNSGRAGRGLGTVFQVAGGFLGAQVVTGIFNAAKGLIGVQASAEQAHIALETVVGSTEKANALFKDVQAFAAATPFQFPELLDATIQMEAFGLKSTDWLQTVGDTAAAMNKPVDQVVQAILDAQTGEYERLKELGIKARVEGDKVTFSYMKNGQQITETVDKNNQAVINSTLQGIWNEKYAGAMEKQSKTFAGQMSTLKDNISLAMQSATASVFQFATKGLAFVNDIFANGFIDTVRGTFGSGVAEFLTNVGNLASGIIEAFGEGTPVADIVAKFPENWQGVADAVLTAADAFGQLWTDLSQGDWSGVAEDLKQLAQAGIDLGTIVVSGVISLGGDLAGNVWERIKNYAGFGAGDGTGGPSPYGNDLSIGEVLISAVIKLTGDLASMGDAIERELGLQASTEEVERARELGKSHGDAIAKAFADGFSLGSGGGESGDGTGGPSAVSITNWQELVAGLIYVPSIFQEDPTFADSAVAYGEGMAHSLAGSIWTGVQNKWNSEVDDLMDWALIAAGIATDAETKITEGLADLDELLIGWPSDWKIDFKTPELGKFPDWNDIFNVAWKGLKALGNLATPWPNAWHLNFGIPSLGDFPSWGDIFNLVWSGLKALGDLSIGWPNSFNINFPSPGINLPSIPGRAMGGPAGGLTLVGERGPEIVSLPRGSYVHTAIQTAAMLRDGQGSGDTIVIDNRGAFIGPGAVAEMRRMIAETGATLIDRRNAAASLSGVRR